MKRYIVRQEVYDGLCNWATDIYIDDTDSLKEAIHIATQEYRKFKIINRMAEFFIYDSEENRVIPREEF